MVAFSDPFKYPEDIAYCDDDSGSSSDLHARTRVVSFATSCSLPPPLLPFSMEKIKLDADTGDRSDRAKPAEHVLKEEKMGRVSGRWEGFQVQVISTHQRPLHTFSGEGYQERAKDSHIV